jgi:5-methylcytosine-specific restriction protein B
MPSAMPRLDLEPKVLDRIRTARDAMNAGGKLPPRDRVQHWRDQFRARFGPERLLALDGAPLLDAMHGRASHDSMTYWLEFKNDDDFSARSLGSIQGGSALKFGIYQAAESGAWKSGSSQQQVELSLSDAIAVAVKQRDELVAAVSALSSFGVVGTLDIDLVDFDAVEASLKKALPSLYGAGWAHKYLSLLFPDRVDDYHSFDYQRFHHARLLLDEAAGRYAAARAFLAIARAIDDDVARASTAINAVHGEPYAYYRVGTSIEGKSGWEQMLAGGFAAVGWRALGDLSAVASGPLDKAAWEAKYKAVYPHAHGPTESNQRKQLLDFVRTAQERDVIVAADGQQVLGIGQITGPYVHRPDLAPFAHTRPVEWLAFPPKGATWKLDEGLQTTFRMLRDAKTWVAVERWRFDDADEGPGSNRVQVMPALAPVIARVERVLRRKGQVILHGPPGTGKTFRGEQAACELASRAWLGRPFREEDRAALVEQGAVELTSFHPAYGYEDFIEGYRPTGSGTGALSFALRDGVMKRLCKRAAATPQKPFFLVIDEINRGDIPRIFGELLSALELDKRGRLFTLPFSGERFSVPPNVRVIGTMNTADRSIALLDVALRRRFGFVELMPEPELLLSTVEGLDVGKWLAALNRRIVQHTGRDARGLQVGHAYLLEHQKPIANRDLFAEVLQEDVIPLLQEYCYEDFAALGKILGNRLVDVDRKTIDEGLFSPARRQELFAVLVEAFPEAIAVAAEPEEKEDDASESSTAS